MTTREAIQHGKEQLDVFGGTHREFIEMAIEALEERKTGKWMRTKSGFLCSECRSGIKNQPLLMGRPMFCYCPFCGVKVEGCE